MVNLETALRRIKMRIGLSITLFLAFVVMHIAAIISNHAMAQQVSIGIAVLALLLLPRTTRPRGILPSSPAEREIWSTLAVLQKWLIYIRTFFLISAILIAVVLPEYL